MGSEPDRLTPADVQELRPTQSAAASDSASSDLAEVLTPESRFRLLEALVFEGGDLMTVSQIVDRAGVSQATASRHLPALETFGVVREGEKMGNARTFRAAMDHPLVQLLRMAGAVVQTGTTPMLLEQQFVGEVDVQYEPGDHPEDPGGWDA